MGTRTVFQARAFAVEFADEHVGPSSRCVAPQLRGDIVRTRFPTSLVGAFTVENLFALSRTQRDAHPAQREVA
jgi:hypothetical protein